MVLPSILLYTKHGFKISKRDFSFGVWYKEISILKSIEFLTFNLNKFWNILFQYEIEICQVIFQQSQVGIKSLAVIGILGSGFFAYLDYSTNPISMYLRLIAITSCALFLIIGNKPKFDISRWFISIFFLVDVETQVRATDVPFYDPLTWITLPMLMLFHAYYFLGVPGYFILFWLMHVAYYFFRVGLSTISNFSDPKLVSTEIFLSAFYIFSSFFNFFWFRVRYTNLLQAKKLFEETQKRIEIERELATQKERQKILFDIHDHAGSSITDVKSLINQLQSNTPATEDFLSTLKFSVQKLEDNLRLKLQTIEDLEILRKDPLSGIRLLILRRYAIYDREIYFFQEENLYDISDENFSPRIVEALFSISQEIATNDLKNGFGLSRWSFSLQGNKLCLEILTFTNYNRGNRGQGNGKRNIELRLKEINGFSFHCEELEKFHARFYLPLLP